MTIPVAVRPAAGRGSALAVQEPALQELPGAVQPALHRPDLAAADLGHPLVRETVDADQHEHLAVRPAEPREGLPERLDLDQRLLRGGPGEGFLGHLVGVGLQADPPAAQAPAEPVAEDREQPSPEVGARGELGLRLEGEHRRVLDEVVGEVRVAGEAARKHPQLRHQCRQLRAKSIRHGRPSRLPLHGERPFSPRRLSPGVGRSG
jgi:hypothetical protein